MKKVYISADVEGLNGITSFNQVLPGHEADYAQMRPQLHLELNALIRGLKRAGVEEIVVNDAHNTMTNITLTDLPCDIKLISGKPKKISMMYGLDESFDGVIFFAYHAKAGSDGVLAHTFNMHFKSVDLNGKKISEAQLNGIYAASLRIPIILASGDDVFCAEIQNDIGALKTIETKKAISSSAAICKQNDLLLNEYESVAEKIQSLPKFFCETSECYELCVEFDTSDFAQKIAQKTGIEAENSFVKFSSSSYVEIYTTLQAISAATTALQKNQNQRV